MRDAPPLIDEEMPVVVIIPNDNSREKSAFKEIAEAIKAQIKERQKATGI